MTRNRNISPGNQAFSRNPGGAIASLRFQSVAQQSCTSVNSITIIAVAVTAEPMMIPGLGMSVTRPANVGIETGMLSTETCHLRCRF